MKQIKPVLISIALLSFLQNGCSPIPIQPAVTPSLMPTISHPTTIPISSPTKTSEPPTIEEMANALFNGEMNFPEYLSNEEYSAFIDEMNAQRGVKPIYVEAMDESGKPIVMYYNTLSRQMESLQGTYAENKEIIDQNIFDVYVEIGNNEQGLITYTHPETAEVVVVENSKGVDISHIVTPDNYKNGTITPPTNGWTIESLFKNRVAIPGILMSNEPMRLVAKQEGVYYEISVLEMLIATNSNYGVRVLVGPQPQFTVMKEGSSEEDRLSRAITRSDKEKLLQNHLYFVFLMPDQQAGWEGFNVSTMDDLKNVSSAATAYQDAIENAILRDGNVWLAAPFLVLNENN